MLICCAANLAAQNIDPGTGTLLTTSKSYYPVWSPDGQWIAGCGMYDGVWIVSSNGGTPEKIAAKPSYKYNGKTYYFKAVNRMSFTPDSKEIIYTSYLIDETKGSIITTTTSGTTVTNEIPVLKAVNVLTKAQRVIREEAEYGRYSRSGRYFAYVNYDHRAVTDPANATHHYSLALYDSVTKETKFFNDAPGRRTRAFSFNHDETLIAAAVTDTTGISAGGKAVESIFMVPINGDKPVDITWRDTTFNLFSFSNPEWSPDGRWILYTALSDTQRMIIAYDTASGKTTPVFPSTPIWNTDASWSPDGKKICCQLELSTTDKGGLYSFDFIEADLNVRPHLKEVAQYIPWEYGTRPVIVDMNTISKDDITYYNNMSSISRYQNRPVWSPDGSSIYFTTSDNGIWKVSSGGGLPSQVKSFFMAYKYKDYMLSVENPSNLSFYAGGKELVFSSGIIDESRGTVVTVTPGNGPDGRNYTGCSISGLIPVMKTIDLGTGDTRIAMDNASYGCYSPSGRYIAYVPGNSGNVTVLDTKTGESRTLSSNYGVPISFDPAETCLYIISGNTGIKIPLNGGANESLFASAGYSGCLSPDGRFFMFRDMLGLSVYDMLTKHTTRVITDKLGYSAVETGSFSPDGKKFCYRLQSNSDGNWYHIYVKDFNTTELGIQTSVAETVPAAFTLAGNHPNPFNPITTVEFSIDRPGAVNLSVYSVTGQKVRELVSGAAMRPGVHTVVWDGRDTNGNAVSSGVYIARLLHDGRAVSRKMMLVR